MQDYNLKISGLREMMKVDNTDIQSDEILGLSQPPLSHARKTDNVIELTKDFQSIVKNNNFEDLINTRTSKRGYQPDRLTLEELSFLLWSTQGVKRVIGKISQVTLRTVPSAGARHPFETYLFINRVEGLEPGLYHYLALEHALEFVRAYDNQVASINEAFGNQMFMANAPVAFVWSVVPYRGEWRYTLDAHKYALIDIGHVCQNLYLASESLGCGACAIGAYNQKAADSLLGFSTKTTSDKESEFVIYAASVGRV
jgi:SagB-type dehydrogenase family enzyme